ncbi:MAG: insulinase family protein [Elusimicrobia bacterium]|nr:insulinase family protein [Elusimicrobiota bacterium]
MRDPLIVLSLVSLMAIPAPSLAAGAAPFRLPMESFTLDSNGLQVVVVPDHSNPTVTVAVSYKVGSQDESKGLGGFAHLFEHLMFQGTRNMAPGDFSNLIKSHGGAYNAYTSKTHTNYHTTIPRNALEIALWAEAERMLSLKVDERALEQEKRVVLEEMRWRYTNTAYVRGIFGAVAELAFDHWENQHPPIGDEADVRNAKLSDVMAFHARFYGPNNAVITLSGDITADDAKLLVVKYFNGAQALPDIVRPVAPERPISEDRHRVVEDPFARLPLLVNAWRLPERGTPSYWATLMLMNILSGDSDNPMYKALVKEQRLATSVGSKGPWFASPNSDNNPELFGFYAMLNPGTTAEQATAAMNQVLRRFAEEGPTDEELEIAKTQTELAAMKSMQTTQRQATTLAAYASVFGDAEGYFQDLERLMAVTREDIRTAVREHVFNARRVTVENVPVPPQTPAPAAEEPPLPEAEPRHAQQQAPPLASAPREVPVPRLERFTLSNGLEVTVVQDNRLKLLEARLSFHRGGRANETADEAGFAKAHSELMLKGTAAQNAEQLTRSFSRLGYALGVKEDHDHSVVNAAGLSRNAERFFSQLSEVLTGPNFAGDEVEEWKRSIIARMRQQRSNPDFLAAERVKAELLAAHPYGRQAPTDAQLSAVDAERLREYHRRTATPNGSSLVLVGDIDPATAREMLERTLGGWQGAVTRVPAPAVPGNAASRMALVERPGSTQATLLVSQTVPLTPRDPDYLPLTVANYILGGGSTSMLYRNLRERNAFTYSAHSDLDPREGGAIWTVQAAVRPAVIKDSLIEITKEIRAIRDNAVTEEELQKARTYIGGNFAMVLAGTSSTSDFLMRLRQQGRDPEQVLAGYQARLQALTPADLQRVARQYIDPDKMVTVVVGDRSHLAPLLPAN